MNNFNIKILKAELMRALENKLVFSGLANTSFSGDITKKNDKVAFNQLGDIDILNYVNGTGITAQTLTDAQLELIADQDKYFAFQLDTPQYGEYTSPVMAEAMRKAAYSLNSTIDGQFAELYAQAGITGVGTDSVPIDLTSLNVEDTFLQMAELFAEAGIPREIRKVAVIPSWVSTKLTLAGITSKTDNSALYTSGYITTALGWDFIESNNVSKNSTAWDKSRIMCLVPNQTLGYAGAVSGIETASVEDQILKTLVKGRYIYGYKVIRPDMLGTIYADKTAEA